jgi:hypothetical protein
MLPVVSCAPHAVRCMLPAICLFSVAGCPSHASLRFVANGMDHLAVDPMLACAAPTSTRRPGCSAGQIVRDEDRPKRLPCKPGRASTNAQGPSELHGAWCMLSVACYPFECYASFIVAHAHVARAEPFCAARCTWHAARSAVRCPSHVVCCMPIPSAKRLSAPAAANFLSKAGTKKVPCALAAVCAALTVDQRALRRCALPPTVERLHRRVAAPSTSDGYACQIR